MPSEGEQKGMMQRRRLEEQDAAKKRHTTRIQMMSGVSGMNKTMNSSQPASCSSWLRGSAKLSPEITPYPPYPLWLKLSKSTFGDRCNR